MRVNAKVEIGNPASGHKFLGSSAWFMKTETNDKTIPAAPARLTHFALFVVLVALFPSLGHAGTWVPFGPEIFVRGSGAPTEVTRSFDILNQNTQYTLRVTNSRTVATPDGDPDDVSKVVITVNGVRVVDVDDFRRVSVLNIPIKLLASNRIGVNVRGRRGGTITVQITGVDNDLPAIKGTISPAPNASGWNNSNVTVSFTCSDQTSGVASCPSPVAVSTEGGNQIISGTAVDKAGNTATASVTVNLDMTPPVISGTINPPPNAAGWNYSNVTVSFTCSDPLSGVALCPSPVAVTTEGANQVATGTAADVAGNTATANITVNIATKFFSVRNYGGKCLDYGAAPNGSGATVFLTDCASAHPVRVEEINVRHEVVLHAGTSVIGIHNPPVNTQGGPPPPPQTEFALELQNYNPNLATTANQIFRLDGDSIILEGNLPCTNSDTDLCPAPLPQLVVQIQNARGANGSPLIAGLRNLADSEFWDFNAADGSGRYPTSGFIAVATNDQLWNSICNSPKASSATPPNFPPTILDPLQPDDGMPLVVPCYDPNFKAGWGTVIMVTSDANECTLASGVGPCIDLSGYPPVTLPAGVTIRGNRRGTSFGPQLYFSFQNRQNSFNRCGACMLEIHGDYARITGLRLRGQSRDKNQNQPATEAIDVDSPGPDPTGAFGFQRTTQFIAIIDHNDISDWGSAAVNALGPYHFDSGTSTCLTAVSGQPYPFPYHQPCSCLVITSTNPSGAPNVSITSDPATLANVRVERNFLHHNEKWGGGYGSLTAAGGRAALSGNTFLMNRHAIASDGEPHNEYRAWYNLVLSSVPIYSYSDCGGTSCLGAQQLFDMHGTYNGYANADNLVGVPNGGIPGGYRVDIAGNTFLGNITGSISSPFEGNNWNFELRGHPCSTDYFRDNVTQRQQDGNGGGVINFHNIGDPGVPLLLQGPDVAYTPVTVAPDLGISEVLDYNNQFGNSSPPYTDPTVRLGPGSLGVGDFDGDGDDDLFLATGTAWYYSPAGAREWRFLSAKTDTIDQLLFGDFDGDGRTDVVALRGGQFMVSWGGVSDWEALNSDPTGGNLLLLPSAIKAMAVGDFDGDGRADIFWADGGTWWISYGGSTPFVQVIVASNLLVKDLRFGDFNGDGTTDVFGVVNGNWMVRYGPKGFQGLLGGWQPLPVSLTNTVDGLLVADFDGDGFADVATGSTDGWQISYRGAQGWTDVPQPGGSASLLTLAGIGHFKGQRGADVVLWNGVSLGPISLGICDSSANVNTQLCISVGGASPAIRYSTQDMR